MLDLLAFGPHPDDVEIGVGGILAGHALKGYACGIIDLTAGEMGSNGTVPQRQAEAREAAEILACRVRECLGLPDTGLAVERESALVIAAALRRWKPRVVLAPYFQGDRHPDHKVAGELVSRAVFLAGLSKLPVAGEPFRPQKLYYYLLTVDTTPDLVMDISSVYAIKEKALAAHQSQFGPQTGEGVATPVNNSLFLRHIHNRDAYFGSLAGVAYGEGLIFHSKPLATDLISWSCLP